MPDQDDIETYTFHIDSEGDILITRQSDGASHFIVGTAATRFKDYLKTLKSDSKGNETTYKEKVNAFLGSFDHLLTR